MRLNQHQALLRWLETPSARLRLRTYLERYQNRNPSSRRFLARPAELLLHLPSHPKEYFTLPLVRINRDLFALHTVNKILAVQSPELEPVILENNWLCRMDMALLRTPASPSLLEEGLSICMQDDLPILLLHNGDEEGFRLFAQVKAYLEQQHLDTRQVLDLQPSRTQPPISPLNLMPGDLEDWLLQRMAALGVAQKYMPPRERLRHDISAHFEQLLREYLIEGLEQQLALTHFLIDLSKTLPFTNMMKDLSLDEQLLQNLTQNEQSEAYATVLHQIVASFFERFIELYGKQVRILEKTWLTQRKGGNYVE